MTDKQLEKLDIHPDKSLFMKKNRYWCNTCQEYLNIPRWYKYKDVINLIYKLGKNHGIEEGKESRSQEFRELLNY